MVIIWAQSITLPLSSGAFLSEIVITKTKVASVVHFNPVPRVHVGMLLGGVEHLDVIDGSCVAREYADDVRLGHPEAPRGSTNL